MINKEYLECTDSDTVYEYEYEYEYLDAFFIRRDYFMIYENQQPPSATQKKFSQLITKNSPKTIENQVC